MEPRIQYAKTSDGVNIAYAVFGTGPSIVSPSNIWGNIHMYKNMTGVTNVFDGLTSMGWSIVTYDGRGSGASDRDVRDHSLESRVRDLEAIVERAAPDRFAIYSYLQGSVASIAYSAQNARRVSHLVLVNPFANGREYYRVVPSLRLSQETLEMAQDEWEFHLITMANAVVGYSDADLAGRLAQAFGTGMSAGDYLAYRRAAIEMDVTDLLAQLTVPTLVIVDSTTTRHANAALARGVASKIPNAHFVETTETARVINDFLREGEPASPAVTDLPSGTAVIFFADIADSTALTERLGDAVFRAKARELGTSLRALIRECGGTPVEGPTLGDGVLAVFTSARAAIEAARRCAKAGDDGGLPLHIGLHAGDIAREKDPDGRDNVYGGAVNIAARISGLSAPGEVLVSETVRSLARTSAGVGFEDRGEQALKGVGEAVRVWAVREGE